MKDEYIIINKTAIQKRIEECNKEISILCRVAHTQTDKKLEITNITIAKLYSEKDTLNLFLSQSIPLIPEIEKAWEHGYTRGYNLACCEAVNSDCLTPDKQDYISNLKLDI